MKKEKKVFLSRGNNFVEMQRDLIEERGESSASISELLAHWIWDLRGPGSDTGGRKEGDRKLNRGQIMKVLIFHVKKFGSFF